MKVFVEEALTEDQQTQFLNTVKFIDCCKGMVTKGEKFKQLEDQMGGGKDQFYEIKAHQIRIGCCFEPGRPLILLHGFLKKRDKWPAGEIRILHNRWSVFDGQRRRSK